MCFSEPWCRWCDQDSLEEETASRRGINHTADQRLHGSNLKPIFHLKKKPDSPHFTQHCLLNDSLLTRAVIPFLFSSFHSFPVYVSITRWIIFLVLCVCQVSCLLFLHHGYCSASTLQHTAEAWEALQHTHTHTWDLCVCVPHLHSAGIIKMCVQVEERGEQQVNVKQNARWRDNSDYVPTATLHTCDDLI